jgi:hypothetical protein
MTLLDEGDYVTSQMRPEIEREEWDDFLDALETAIEIEEATLH